MEHAIPSIVAEPEHTVEIVVHVSETLEDQQRHNMVAALENDDRIVAVTFCPTRCHLMLVKYDRDRYSSSDVLGSITAQNVNARLIGPV
jgi:hypothetical protein